MIPVKPQIILLYFALLQSFEFIRIADFSMMYKFTWIETLVLKI